MSRAIFDLLEQFEIRKQIVDWMADAEKANRLEERGEHEQVWSELINLFEELVEFLGDEQIAARRIFPRLSIQPWRVLIWPSPRRRSIRCWSGRWIARHCR